MTQLKSSLTIVASLLLGGVVSLVPQSIGLAKSRITDEEIAQFRSQGSAGIDRFLKINGAEMAKLRTKADTPRWQELTRALDRICQQRDCEASRLYWHTDFKAAKQAAAASNKPILSLRMLGNLDEDLSCANSRFFRITLYADPEIAQLLRDKYILHWQSVRPVPKITIDFGDGRKVEQTITGNSIHYILDKTGRPLDALPGLYAPQAFKRQLIQGAEFAGKYHQLAERDRQDAFIDTYHQAKLVDLQANWKQDMDKLGIDVPIPTSLPRLDIAPTAIEASRVAMSKRAIELPLLRQTRISAQREDLLKKATEDGLWEKLGALHQADAVLAENSRALIRRKQPQLVSLNVENKSKSSDRIPELISRFEKLIAIDSIRNEYLLHSQLHQWFMKSGRGFSVASSDVESLNAQVYDRLFLTPQSDRWLGLMPDDGYTGIDRDGIVYR